MNKTIIILMICLSLVLASVTAASTLQLTCPEKVMLPSSGGAEVKCTLAFDAAVPNLASFLGAITLPSNFETSMVVSGVTAPLEGIYESVPKKLKIDDKKGVGADNLKNLATLTFTAGSAGKGSISITVSADDTFDKEINNIELTDLTVKSNEIDVVASGGSSTASSTCGNGKKDPLEVCDGEKGKYCSSKTGEGVMDCTADCTWGECVASMCGTGNAACVAGETKDCPLSNTLAYAQVKTCKESCKDYSQCVATEKYGDGIKNGPEQCDQADFGGKTCVDFGFTGGVLKCSEAKIDTSGCTTEKQKETSPVPGANVDFTDDDSGKQICVSVKENKGKSWEPTYISDLAKMLSKYFGYTESTN